MRAHFRDTRRKFNLLDRHNTLITLIGDHGAAIPESKLVDIGAKGSDPTRLQEEWGTRLRKHDYRLGRLAEQIRGLEERLRAEGVKFEPWQPLTLNDIRGQKSQEKPRGR